jgi:tRNA pseudouridine55 synthase
MNQQNKTISNPLHSPHGILLVNKPKGKTSFSLVAMLRKKLNVKKIGHAGTLDPFATGVMVMLIGKEYTRLSDSFLTQDKEYVAQLRLGITTDSYDCEGQIVAESDNQPTLESIHEAVKHFQGEIEQLPPMFSAKKIDGKRLYTLARQGVTVERAPVKVKLETQIIEYAYPFLTIQVKCTKGTYIRSIANDLGVMLGCGAHLSALERTRSGKFTIQECLDGDQLYIHNTDILPWIKK